MFPEVTITVGRTHWRCLTCKLLNKRVVSIDQHIKSKHPSLQETTKQSGVSKSAVHESNSYSDGEIETVLGHICTLAQKVASAPAGHSSCAKRKSRRPVKRVDRFRLQATKQHQTRKHVSKEYGEEDTKYEQIFESGNNTDSDTDSLQGFGHSDKPLVHFDPLVLAAAASNSTGAGINKEVKTEKRKSASKNVSKKRKATKQDPETVVVKKRTRVDFKPGRLAVKRRDVLDSEKKVIKESYVVSVETAGACSLMETSSKPTQQPPVRMQTKDTMEASGDQASIQADDFMQKLQLVNARASSLPQGVHNLSGTKARNRTSLQLDYERTQRADFTSQPDIENSHSDTAFMSAKMPKVTPQTDDSNDKTEIMTHNARTTSDSQLRACGFNTSDLHQLSTVNATQASNHETNPPQIFNCTICSAKFSCLESFAMHESEVAAYGVTQCRKCTKSFHGVHLLNVHVFGEHEIRKKGFCFECGQVFDSMEKLERHCYSHVLKRECPLTEMRFHECKICSRETLGEFAVMQSHYNKVHKANLCFDCYISSDVVYFIDPAKNKEHKQTHEKVCTLCSQEFTSREGQLSHYFEHCNSLVEMENGSGRVCDKCGQWCANRLTITVHEKWHKLQKAKERRAKDAEERFTCLQCDKVYNSQKTLNWHINIAHGQNRIYKFRCEFCGKGVDCKVHLQDHIALHHLGVKRYACEYCDQRFVCRPTLRRHVLKEHEKDKQYRCEFCGESFCDKSKLQGHTYIHTGKARFVCEHCGKGCHTRSTFKIHMAVHAATRDFVCQRCGQGYKRKSHLAKHLRSCVKSEPSCS